MPHLAGINGAFGPSVKIGFACGLLVAAPIAHAGERPSLVQRSKERVQSIFRAPLKGATTALQRGVVGIHTLASTGVGAAIVEQVATSPHPIRDGAVAAAAGFVGWHAADAVGSPAHFALDNYSLGEPSMRFQTHHLDTQDGAGNHPFDSFYTLGKYTLPLVVVQAATAFSGHDPSTAHIAAEAFGLTLLNGIAMTTRLHTWAHTPKSMLGPVARFMQWTGFAITSREHGKHHFDAPNGKDFKEPSTSHQYGVQSGASNRLFDKLNVYDHAERAIYKVTGAVPNSWKDERGYTRMVRLYGKERADEIKGEMESK